MSNPTAATPPANNIWNATFCKHCSELIRDDEKAGWVHVANANAGTWYRYCEMKRGNNAHIDSVATPGELLQAERDEAAYQSHVARYANAVYIDPEVDYR